MAFDNVVWSDIGWATLETLIMLGGSLFFTIVIGLPLGIILFLTSEGQVWQGRWRNTMLGFIVNALRSVPFIILLIVMIPLTVLLVGTSIGVAGAIPPLVVGAVPFFARLVETALKEVDRSAIEAVRAMGARAMDLVWRALLPEALPGIIAGATVTAIALVNFTAMAGAVGAGGLGDLAIRFGYQRFQADVMLITVILLLLLVQTLQWIGDHLAARFNHR